MPRRSVALLARVPPIAVVVALVCMVAIGRDDIAQPLALLAVVLAPTLLPRALLYPAPDGGEDHSGGSPGPEPDAPGPPGAPSGGLPLLDATPANVRRRDHNRPPLIRPRPRRQATEPERAPRRRRLPGR